MPYQQKKVPEGSKLNRNEQLPFRKPRHYKQFGSEKSYRSRTQSVAAQRIKSDLRLRSRSLDSRSVRDDYKNNGIRQNTRRTISEPCITAIRKNSMKPKTSFTTIEPSKMWVKVNELKSKMPLLVDLSPLSKLSDLSLTSDSVADIFKFHYWKIYYTSEISFDSDCDNIIKTISSEMRKKFFEWRLSLKNYTEKLIIWKRLGFLIANKNEMYDMVAVGSTITGLATNDSNLNLLLLTDKVEQRLDSTQHLEVLFNLLEPLNEVIILKLTKEPIPTLSFTVYSNKFLLVNVEICCDNQERSINSQLIYAYTQSDHRFQPLFVVIKLWAKHCGICASKKNQLDCLNSFTLQLMVIQFLQSGVTPPVLPNLQNKFKENYSWTVLSSRTILKMFPVLNEWKSTNTCEIFEILWNFFDYYKNFNFKETLVSIRYGQPAFKSSYNSANGVCVSEAEIFVEEPFTRLNTVQGVDFYILSEKINKECTEAKDRLCLSKNLEALFQ